MQNKLEHSEQEKARPGRVISEIKSSSPHLALVPGTRKGTPKCCAEEEKERRVSTVIFTAGKSHWLFYFFFLSSRLNQKTSSRKGGRIRGAPEQPQRKRVGSLILMGFLEVPPSLWRCSQRAWRINRRDSLLY